MNKVLTVNLGGYPFTIDEDAYDHLRRYLDTIHRHFKTSEGYEEITQDIEARLAELFRERLGNRPIVNLKDVEAAIATMGTPQEFGAEPMDQPGTGSSQSGYKTGRRLFRDEENAHLGGVSAGIAAYFGINDPTWVRLAFLVFAGSGGFGIPLYIVLWAILPKAKTASDRLSMRGEPINVSNIGRIIEEELGINFSEEMNKLGQKFRTKKTAFAEGGEQGNLLAQGIAFLGQVLRVVFGLVTRIIRPLLIALIVLIVLAFAVAWIGSFLGIFFGVPALGNLLPLPASALGLATFNILLLFSLPLVSLVLVVSRALFKTRVSSYWQIGLFVLWVLNLASFGFIGIKTGQQFMAQATVNEDIPLQVKGLDTLTLSLSTDSREQETVLFDFDGEAWLTENALVVRDIELDIRQTDKEEFRLVRQVHSRGRYSDEAKQMAGFVQYPVQQQGNQLLLSDAFFIDKQMPYRAQEVRLILEVPRGKTVFMSSELKNILREAELSDSDINPWGEEERFWRMSDSGLACLDCQ